MHTCAEGEVRVRVSRDVEPVRNVELGGIAVRRRQERGEHVAAPEIAAVQLAVADRETRFRHLHRRDMAQALLYAGRHQARVATQATHLILVREQREESAGNQMGGRLLPRAEE